MFVVIGANGATGGAVVRALLQAGEPVRGIVRKAEQAKALQASGAEAALADVADPAALTKALEGAEVAYLMSPPATATEDMFAKASQYNASIAEAVRRAGIRRAVALSSVGSELPAGTGNILTTHDLETRLSDLPIPITFIRAATFMDNFAWVMTPVTQHGVLPTMQRSAEKKAPMQSTEDIGRTAAALMLEPGDADRIIELHGPADYSPADAAAIFTGLLGRQVHPVVVPEEKWEETLRAQHLPEITVQALCEMYRGFNSGLIRFQGTHETRRGQVTLEQYLSQLVRHSDR